MNHYFLTKKAYYDLVEIGRYTKKQWGVKQRNLYLNDLEAAFKLITKHNKLGKSCDDILIGYRKFDVQKHMIFYRVMSDGIEIVRILHISMDYQAHL